MNFFRGYIKTKGKQAAEPFKNKTSFQSYDDVKGLDSFAGILAENAVLVDIDDAEQSEILLDIVDDLNVKCRVYATTRGKHFFVPE